MSILQDIFKDHYEKMIYILLEKLHTSGHAYVETIEKLIRLTNPKVIIPMHTECAETFGRIPAFAAYQDRVKVMQDGEAYYF